MLTDNEGEDLQEGCDQHEGQHARIITCPRCGLSKGATHLRLRTASGFRNLHCTRCKRQHYSTKWRCACNVPWLKCDIPHHREDPVVASSSSSSSSSSESSLPCSSCQWNRSFCHRRSRSSLLSPPPSSMPPSGHRTVAIFFVKHFPFTACDLIRCRGDTRCRGRSTRCCGASQQPGGQRVG